MMYRSSQMSEIPRLLRCTCLLVFGRIAVRVWQKYGKQSEQSRSHFLYFAVREMYLEFLFANRLQFFFGSFGKFSHKHKLILLEIAAHGKNGRLCISPTYN